MSDELDIFLDKIENEVKEVKARDYIDLEQNNDEIEENNEIEEKKSDFHTEERPLVDRSVNIVKNIYCCPNDLKNKSQEEIDKLRFELGNITVNGLNIPCPITSWAHCGLPESVMTRIRHEGFKKPTAIQCQVIPCVLSGRDLIGCAVTGSGKTLAFLLPCLLHVMAQSELRQNESAAIILSPTRELAIQTYGECKKFLSNLNLRFACLVGGCDIEYQYREIKSGAHIIVATPGRFIDLIQTNKTFNLGRVGFLVLDEADRMFDFGFEPQIVRIASMMRKDRQTIMFSATFPKTVERLARQIMINSIEVIVGTRNVVSSEVRQFVEIIKEEDKYIRLLQIISKYQDKGQALVFTNSRNKTEEVFGKLNKDGYKSSILHAGMSQSDRSSILRDFRDRKLDILVLTSVGSRGIDIDSVILVVNYDVPDHEADYVHRIGRTGRAGKTGYAYTLITPQEKGPAIEIRSSLKKTKSEIPEDLEKLCGNSGNVKFGHIGYRIGSGYKFDKAENESFNEKRRALSDLNDKDINEIEEEKFKTSSITDSIKHTLDGNFIYEFTINHLPLITRGELLKFETLENISDESGVNIVQKGVYVKPSERVPKGQRELYLLIEGSSRYAVETAVNRINEIISKIRIV